MSRCHCDGSRMAARGRFSFAPAAAGEGLAPVRGRSGVPSSALGARGLRPRVQLIRTEKRASYLAPKRLERLNSTTPARIHPRPGRMLDRRANLEIALRRSLIVARRHRVAKASKEGI